MKGDKIKIFHLIRDKDITGTSGTGIVGIGAVLPSGRVIMEWIASNHSTIEICNSLDEIKLLHGHNGNSRIIKGNPK